MPFVQSVEAIDAANRIYQKEVHDILAWRCPSTLSLRHTSSFDPVVRSLNLSSMRTFICDGDIHFLAYFMELFRLESSRFSNLHVLRFVYTGPLVANVPGDLLRILRGGSFIPSSNIGRRVLRVEVESVCDIFRVPPRPFFAFFEDLPFPFLSNMMYD